MKKIIASALALSLLGSGAAFAAGSNVTAQDWQVSRGTGVAANTAAASLLQDIQLEASHNSN